MAKYKVTWHGTVIDGSWPLTLEVQNRGVEPETPHLGPHGGQSKTESCCSATTVGVSDGT